MSHHPFYFWNNKSNILLSNGKSGNKGNIGLANESSLLNFQNILLEFIQGED